VHTQSEACIRTLIDCGIDLEAKDIDELTPFGEAVASTRLDIIKIFLDIPDVDVNSRCFYSMTPLHLTLFMEKEKGHAEVLQLLLAHDRVEVDLADESSWTPLSRAAHSGAEWAVRLLLDDGRSSVEHADSQGRTPVHLAAKRGHDKIVKMLLESERAHVNTPDHDGETPLFTAASRGRLRVVNELLADPQIDVNSPDMDDCSPL
ncbi:ankyrin, partial [Choiromyces venosus 120613-1]